MNGPEVVGAALLAARNAMALGEPLDGYAALAGPYRIPGLGPAFGSKFLYFASPEHHRALIFDQLVADWLGENLGLRADAARWSVRTYRSYLETMSRWAAQVDIPTEQLEEILFTEEATRRGLTVWGH